MISSIYRPLSMEGRRSRKVIAYQFDRFLLPRVQWNGSIDWQYRDTTQDSAFLEDGFVDVSQYRRRAPLDRGNMTWNGKYGCVTNGPTREGCKADSEVSGIMSLSGLWRPLVVFVEDDTVDRSGNECGIVSTDNCGTWMWTFAKLETPSIKGSIDDIIKGAETMEIKFVLREPFREVDPVVWRWGHPAPIKRARTYGEAEALVAGGDRRYPCQLPDCSDSLRWHYRDPMACIDLNCACFYDLDCLWGTQNYRLLGNAYFGMNVAGTFEATGFIKAGNDGVSVKIINDIYGEQTVLLNNNQTLDLDKGEVFNGCTPVVSQMARMPRITPGINRFVYSGRVLLGVRPRWLL